jgi:hypothetical protein
MSPAAPAAELVEISPPLATLIAAASIDTLPASPASAKAFALEMDEAAPSTRTASAAMAIGLYLSEVHRTHLRAQADEVI